MTTPLQSTKVFDAAPDAVERADVDVMTVRGTVRTLAALIGIMLVGGAIGWAITAVTTSEDAAPPAVVFVAAVVAFAAAIWAQFRPYRAPVLAPVYAAAEGLAVGSVSRHYEALAEGVVVQAIGATVATLAAMAILYCTGLLRVTHRFRTRVLGAAAGLLLFWLVTAALHVGGVDPTYLRAPGVAVLVSLVSAALAACFLVLDFEVIEAGVRDRAPRTLEWYAALGLVITLVWLYLELLALMADGDE